MKVRRKWSVIKSEYLALKGSVPHFSVNLGDSVKRNETLQVQFAPLHCAIFPIMQCAHSRKTIQNFSCHMTSVLLVILRTMNMHDTRYRPRDTIKMYSNVGTVNEEKDRATALYTSILYQRVLSFATLWLK